MMYDPLGQAQRHGGDLMNGLLGIYGIALVTLLGGLSPVLAETASTFVYADAGEPSTIDPAKANVNFELTVTRNVYDRLVDFDLNDPSRLLPALATEWKQDGKTWTFKLRDGVKFHDGQGFDATDVKATLDRLLKIGQGQSYLVDDIASVTVLDPLTVKIETKAPTVFLASNLSR